MLHPNSHTESLQTPAKIWCVAIDDTNIYTCHSDHKLRIWDRETKGLVRELSDHAGEVRFVSVDGDMMASGGDDCRVILWKRCDGLWKLVDARKDNSDYVMHTQLQRRTLMTSSNDNTAVIYRVKCNKMLLTHRLEGHANIARAVAFNSRFVVTGSFDQTVKVRKQFVYLEIFKTFQIWSRKTGSYKQTFHGHEHIVNCIAVFQHYAISGSWDKTIR